MPINRNLLISPYYDDYDITKQFHRILFKPAYAVQARELTQMQTILQNQIEQFGSNIFQEGSIIKGCTFTQLNSLKYVKLADKVGFDISLYVGGIEDGVETYYELVNNDGLRASIVAATPGFETRNPDLNTFYINYVNTASLNQPNKQFSPGQSLNINRYEIEDGITTGPTLVESIQVTTLANPVGDSYGVNVSDGIIFQKGHFVYTPEQTVIVSKYDSIPDDVSVGFIVEESLVSALQDDSLFDNAIGVPNQNAPGADRLKLSPILSALTPTQIAATPNFFTLLKYETGNLIEIRNVSQFNSIAQEMARRTFEESGNYIVKDFQTKIVKKEKFVTLDANNNPVYTEAPYISLGPGVAYVNGFRVENAGERFFEIDPITNTDVGTLDDQPISFEYGGYLEVTDASGVLSIADYSRIELANNSVVIGSAIVKNFTSTKLYLTDIRMDTGVNFSSVTQARQDVSSSYISVIAQTIDTSTSNVLVFDTGVKNVKSVSNLTVVVRDRVSKSVTGGNTVVHTLTSPDEDYNIETQDLLVINSSNQVLDVDSYAYSGSNKTLTINLGASPSPGSTVTLYYNKRIVFQSPDADPRSKQLVEAYVKTTFDTALTKYTLGLPDVLEIVSITGSAANTDFTDSFKLFSNQKDNVYDLSYIEYDPATPAPADGEVLTIRLKVFQLEAASRHVFTVNSYGNLSADQIPYFTSTNGTLYNLENCIDFRPYRTAIASYAVNAGSATLFNPAANTSHVVDQTVVIDAPSPSLSYLIPAPDNTGTVDIDYYYNRTDVIAIDSYGKFGIVKGVPAAKSRPPRVDSKMVIAEVLIPSNLLYTKDEVLDGGPNTQYVPVIEKRGVKAYTMEDIADIAREVERLTYYASVFALQSSAQDLTILDDNGLNRFKNGILVDPFTDFSIADISNIEFNASIDFTENTVSPSVVTFPMNLIVDTTTLNNIVAFPNVDPETVTITNELDNVVVLEQVFATSFRNCTSNLYSFKATGVIHPDYDAAYDTVTNPVRLDIDLATPFSEMVRGIQRFVPLTSTSSRLVSSSVERSSTTRRQRRGGLAGAFGKSRRVTQTVTTTNRTFEDVTRSLRVGTSVREQNLGEFVTNQEFLPYMRSREVRVAFYGLRPNTRHYAFFDKVDVNAHTAPAGFPGGSSSVPSLGAVGAYGDPLSSNSEGVLTVIFRIPPERFFVGERSFEVFDVNSYDAVESAATSRGFVNYNAYNFSVEKSGVVASTRTARPTVVETRTNRTVTTRSVTTRRPQVDRRRLLELILQRSDPIAQTFFIKEGMAQGADTIFVSSIDLYFKRKSTVNGVSVMLRETVNGFPGTDIIPFSLVHLKPSEVAVSEDASIATNVRFSSPVRLDVEKEYCFVVQPDADDPEYLIYIAQIGQNDLTTGEPVNVSWGDGILFTSTNNRAWQSYQSEDIKFTLYRHEYNSVNVLTDPPTPISSTVELKLDYPEFFTISSVDGKFNMGELVYNKIGSANTVSVTAGNTFISGTGIGNAGYSVGDYILIEGPTYSELLKISATSAQTGNTDQIVAATPSSLTGEFSAYSSVVGRIVRYDHRNPVEMYLEGSSARIGKLFAGGNTIYGINTGASAVISSVDNMQISYIQPFINKTTDSDTSVTMTGLFSDSSLSHTNYEIDVPFNDKTTFNERGATVFSTSNNLLEDPQKRFGFELELKSDSNTTTPFVDVGPAHVMMYKYNITSASANTSTTSAKYISKVVELEQDFEAEDFQLYVTAYKPTGTTIKTYIRVQNSSDSLTFESNDWIELELDGAGLNSSTINRNDFREYVYKVPASKKTGGALTYTNTSGEYTGYSRFAVKIEMLSSNVYNVPRILDYRGIALT